MKIKRIIAAVMALVLVGGAYPFNTANNTNIVIAEAADSTASQSNVIVSNGIKYTIKGDTASVTGFTTGFDQNAVIPAEVDGCPVTKISSKAFINSGIETLVLGENIESIESNAFQNCPLLTEVTLNDNLKRIEGYAFQDCVTLSKVSGGSNIEYFGFMAFESCVKLSDFELGEKVRYIGDSAFARTNIKELVIPESVNTLYDCPVGISPASSDPMYNANATVIIKNPECKLEINSVSKKSNWDKCMIVCDDESKAHTFADEYSVNFCTPEQYENGDYDKFELSELDELECLRKYGMSFEKCDGGLAVYYITVQNGNTITIPDEVGGLPVVKCELNTPSAKPHAVTPMAVYSGIEKVVIGKNVKFIGDLSFNSYINLKTVEGGEGLERIGYGAFCSLQKLESFIFGSDLKTIDNIAFAGCVKLGSLEFPDSLESIGDSAFSSCISVNSVKFGKGLKNVGSSAFSGCNSVKEVKLYEGQKEIVSDAFSSAVSFITEETSSKNESK
ncbi:leucine-rich repeat domain-containing protein, partial [Ruminococcus flavefaciens]|uniref:leucine-rich repeat domain-containing protein n=1 Tax=Ruminococcus flavefaciens TaxID=1265 RepID=UPI00048EAED7